MFRPSFNKGSILKKNMLDALRDYPYTVLDVKYSDYGDGILSGFKINALENEQFSISPGILKINGEIYTSPVALTLEQVDEKHYVYLVIEQNDNPDGSEVDLKIEQTTELRECGWELFRYTKNANMYEYKDVFELFATPMNRINQLFCKFAIVGGNTLNPSYFRMFAKAVLSRSNATAEDVAFAYQCLNGIHDIEVIKQYFDGKTSTHDILEEMKSKLSKMGETDSVPVSQPEEREPPKKMIVS